MNVIIVCSDTFRFDHLGFLKRQPVQTPNLDQLAAESSCFTDYRLSSFPTIVNRIEVFSGRHAFPFFNWGPQPRQHPTLPEVFRRHGYTTALFTDNLHLTHDGWDYGRGFDTVGDIPGQMHDVFQPASAPMVDLPCPASKLDVSGYRLERYRRNAFWYRQQKTSTTAALFQSALQWLERPRHKFFLWLDAFDPHEPWDAPSEFQDRYPLDPAAERIIWPRVGYSKNFSAAELENMRRLYRAEVSQVDFWMGRLLAQLRDRQQLADTAVVFCSDHGFYFGEHGLLGKPTLRRVPQPTRFYDELAHPPLLIRHPGGLGKGQLVPGLCQPPDLFATALELAGLDAVPWSHGHSLLPRVAGEPSRRRLAVGGSFPIRKDLVACLALWTDEWTLLHDPFQGLAGSELYHRIADPAEQHNLIQTKPEVARALHEELVGWLTGLGVSQRRQAQLLRNEDFPRFPALSQRLDMWRANWFHWRHYRRYLPDAGAVS